MNFKMRIVITVSIIILVLLIGYFGLTILYNVDEKENIKEGFLETPSKQYTFIYRASQPLIFHKKT